MAANPKNLPQLGEAPPTHGGGHDDNPNPDDYVDADKFWPYVVPDFKELSPQMQAFIKTNLQALAQAARDWSKQHHDDKQGEEARHEGHAMGLLNTDWGDYGHINHPDFSRIGMIYGAAFSWNADILPEEEINRQISVLEFGDASGKLVSVLDLLCHQDAYPWRTAVMVQEALELHQDKEEAAELLRSCAEGDADAANASIDALCAVLYEKAGTVRPENRPMIYAYLLAADGLKVLNRLLPFLRASLLSEGTLPEKEDCFALAGDLERWLHSYKELWRTVSKESELYRIAHVFCWYADLLRDLNA